MNINSDIELDQFEELTVKVKDFAESFVDTVHEPFMLMNKNKKVMYANISFYHKFKVTFDETIGTVIYNIGNHQ